MSETRINVTDLERNISEVLDRAQRQGEHFIVERNGEAIAAIGPVVGVKGITVEEFAALLSSLEWPDDDFARDLEQIQAEQPKAELFEWPD